MKYATEKQEINSSTTQPDNQIKKPKASFRYVFELSKIWIKILK